MNVSLFLDDTTLHRSKMGAIWGSIWLAVDSRYFPAPRWSDLAFAFLRAWLEALIEIAAGASRHETVSFMDGPYTVELLAGEQGFLDIRFVHNKSDQDLVVAIGKVKLFDVLQNAVEVATRVVQ